MGRVVLEGRDAVPECVHVEMSGVPEGQAQRFIPDQSYSLAIKVQGYCGRTSFGRNVDAALRLEFDRAASSRPLPSVVIPLHFTLVNKVAFPDSIDLTLQGASSKALDLHVTSNSERTVEFRAVLPPVKERRGWPGENLRLALVGEDDKPVRKDDGSLALDKPLRLGPQMQGEFARFRVTADACCEGGTYRTKVAFVPKMGAKEVIQIPVNITVLQAGAWRCWGGTILWSLLGVFWHPPAPLLAQHDPPEPFHPPRHSRLQAHSPALGTSGANLPPCPSRQRMSSAWCAAPCPGGPGR